MICIQSENILTDEIIVTREISCVLGIQNEWIKRETFLGGIMVTFFIFFPNAGQQLTLNCEMNSPSRLADHFPRNVRSKLHHAAEDRLNIFGHHLML